MAERSIDKLTDALSAPLGDLISSVADGVAQAQGALDRQTIQTFKEIYQSNETLQKELQRIGYQPTWYKIPEVKAEIVMTLSIGERETVQTFNQLPEDKRPQTSLNLYAAPVDAYYANRYGYNIQGASTLKFTIVAVPPTAQAESIQVVPNLSQKSLAEARDLLEQLGIEYGLEISSGSQISIISKEEEIENLLAARKNENKPEANVLFSKPAAGEILKTDQLLLLSID